MVANEITSSGKKEPKMYYVYTLSKSDGSVFYVGKGCTRKLGSHFFDRMDDHERDAKRPLSKIIQQGRNLEKCQVIQSIWASGEQVVKQKVYETDVEINAYIYEWALINMVYGIDHLTNKEYRGVRKPKSIVLPVVLSTPPPMPPQEKRILVTNGIMDANEVAQLLKLNEQTVKRLANRGELPGFKIGGRWRFRREAIEEYIRMLEQQQGDQKQED